MTASVDKSETSYPFINFLSGEKLRVNNVYCVGRNYEKHAKELGHSVPTTNPVIFLKSNAAIRTFDDQGRIYSSQEVYDHEVEIVLVVGKTIARKAKFSPNHLAGLAIGLDVTRRDIQKNLKTQGLPWTLAKSFEGSAIVSDVIPSAMIKDLTSIKLELKVNGALRQSGHSESMIFSIPQIFEFILDLHSLYPGDVIFTGTPEGVGSIRIGDKFEATLDRWDFSGVL